MVVYSNCKINIGLNIVGKRMDGYHDIETIMYPIKSLCDIVEVVVSGDDVTYSESGLVVDCPPEKNLCVKAARLMQKEYGVAGVAIHLHKNVPFGAGLGGGSSNATSVILALNTLFKLNLSEGRLEDLSAKLGSDTPFFVRNIPQFVHGRGDLLTPVELDLSGKYIVLIKPNIAVSTAEAYSGVVPAQPKDGLCALVAKDISTWKDAVHNDFEHTLFPKYSALVKIKQKLYDNGAIYASMSGSGSSVFGLFETPPQLEFGDNQIFIHQSKL